MEKGKFNRWLFEVMNTVTLVAERRGRILGFLHATLEETSARIVFLAVRPEYRRRGIGTALHQELKAHIPREVAFVGGYTLLDSPVIPFLEKICWQRSEIEPGQRSESEPPPAGWLMSEV